MNPWTALATGSVTALLMTLPVWRYTQGELRAPAPAYSGLSVPDDTGPDPDDFGTGWTAPPSFAVIGLPVLMRSVTARFPGRLLSATLAPPLPDEQSRDVALVYVLRLLTPAGDVLQLRVDARDGAFLDITGHDLGRAQQERAP